MHENCIQTFTGKMIDPFDPDPEAIDIRDIAHALSLTCRFNGHVNKFYSVAEHSVRVHDLLIAEINYLAGAVGCNLIHDRDIAVIKWGLIHDSAESVLSDICRPIKRRLLDYNKMEDSLLEVIIKTLSIDPLTESEHKIVKKADNILLATEKRDLMKDTEHLWVDVTEEPQVMPIIPFPPEEAERLFLIRWYRYNNHATI